MTELATQSVSTAAVETGLVALVSGGDQNRLKGFMAQPSG